MSVNKSNPSIGCASLVVGVDEFAGNELLQLFGDLKNGLHGVKSQK